MSRVRWWPVLPALLTIVVLPTLHAQAIAPRRVILRLLVGGAVPFAPSEFRADWNHGPSVATSIGYSVSPRLELALAAEYGSFGSGDAAAPPSPAVVTTRRATPLWAAWLDGAFTVSSGPVRPRAHLGLGIVALGAARTAPALQLGIGIERSLGVRLAAFLDAALAHAFTADPRGQARIAEPLSYMPIRVGVVWR